MIPNTNRSKVRSSASTREVGNEKWDSHETPQCKPIHNVQATKQSYIFSQHQDPVCTDWTRSKLLCKAEWIITQASHSFSLKGSLSISPFMIFPYFFRYCVTTSCCQIATTASLWFDFRKEHQFSFTGRRELT